MYEQDLGLNNLQWLICYETNQPTYYSIIIICLYTVISFQAFPSNTNDFPTNLFNFPAGAVEYTDCISAEG